MASALLFNGSLLELTATGWNDFASVRFGDSTEPISSARASVWANPGHGLTFAPDSLAAPGAPAPPQCAGLEASW
jgi:hypothetical protein